MPEAKRAKVRNNDDSRRVVGSLERARFRYSCLKSRAGWLPGYEDVKVLMTVEQFVEWFMPRDFEGCEVDRINGGNYELGNIQLLTKREHSLKTQRENGAAILEGEHTCRGCGCTKAATEFNKDNRRAGGVSNFCLDCTNEKVRLRRLKK